MMQVIDGTIREEGVLTATSAASYGPSPSNIGVGSSNWQGVMAEGPGRLVQNCQVWSGGTSPYSATPYYVYANYPVYVCQDNTRKAIDILKALQASGDLQVVSVSAFIALVEKISGLL